jgi:hypothetical protein
MHAVVVKVTIQDVEPAEEVLRNEIVPRVSQMQGFVNGFWSRKDNSGLSFIVFESEDAAQAASKEIEPPPQAPVTVDDVEVREIVAQA